MDTNTCISLIEDLIRFPSVTGEEEQVVLFLSDFLKSKGWNVEFQFVAMNRKNIYATKSKKPFVIYTTHLDVVLAKDSQFTPFQKDGRIYGRGACDAKGVAATMIAAVEQLESVNDIALLFVVGEEVDGVGAKLAASELKGRNIRYLINGEPTEGRLVSGHKGSLGFSVKLSGKACHSGYPELGDDANAKLIKLFNKLSETNFGSSPGFGKSTINIGQISGGVASNVVSPRSELKAIVRTVLDQEESKEILNKALDGYDWQLGYDMKPMELVTLPGFETEVASYCTDLPYLESISKGCLLYGPGSIHQAHTVNEFIEVSQIDKAISGYKELYNKLKNKVD